ncbi:hypothetical protein H6F43_05000 [Leptolyngbya sp. FACHB-36]|nr:hypothetical protein [Leptolyngbya sp. FACHB-36]
MVALAASSIVAQPAFASSVLSTPLLLDQAALSESGFPQASQQSGTTSFWSAHPSSDDYNPPDVGGPGSTKGTGTR